MSTRTDIFPATKYCSCFCDRTSYFQNQCPWGEISFEVKVKWYSSPIQALAVLISWPVKACWYYCRCDETNTPSGDQSTALSLPLPDISKHMTSQPISAIRKIPYEHHRTVIPPVIHSSPWMWWSHKMAFKAELSQVMWVSWSPGTCFWKLLTCLQTVISWGSIGSVCPSSEPSVKICSPWE